MDYTKDMNLMRSTIYRDINGALDIDKFRLAYKSKVIAEEYK